MGDEVIIVSIVFGSVVSIVFLGIIGSVIKAWVKKRGGNDLSKNEEFLEALKNFKEKTDRRLSNLEAIVIDDEAPVVKNKNVTIPGRPKPIEIDENTKDSTKKTDGNLRNMLKE